MLNAPHAGELAATTSPSARRRASVALRPTPSACSCTIRLSLHLPSRKQARIASRTALRRLSHTSLESSLLPSLAAATDDVIHPIPQPWSHTGFLDAYDAARCRLAPLPTACSLLSPPRGSARGKRLRLALRPPCSQHPPRPPGVHAGVRLVPRPLAHRLPQPKQHVGWVDRVYSYPRFPANSQQRLPFHSAFPVTDLS